MTLMAYCPIHRVPIYPTNKGGVACIRCEKAKRNGTDGKYTEIDAAKLAANRESSRKSMARKRALRREAGGERRKS